MRFPFVLHYYIYIGHWLIFLLAPNWQVKSAQTCVDCCCICLDFHAAWELLPWLWKSRWRKKLFFFFGKFSFLTLLLMWGQQFVNMEGWRKRGWKLWQMWRPPTQETFAGESNQKVRTWRDDSSHGAGLPSPSRLFFHFPLLLRTLCLSVPCLPTFLLPQSPWLIN